MGCGVCDTPEFWRGAADLYARVLVLPNLYVHTYIHRSPAQTRPPDHRLTAHLAGAVKNVIYMYIYIYIYVYIYIYIYMYIYVYIYIYLVAFAVIGQRVSRVGGLGLTLNP